MNKFLSVITLFLLPVTIVSFDKETNFIMEQKEPIKINIINNNEVMNIDLEKYIVGVVAGEMPASFTEEALKAQAVASRTYAYKHFLNNQNLEITTDDQIYLTEEQMKEKWQDKYQQYVDKIKKCVEETRNEVLTYNGEVINAYYYSMSNGYTESSLNVYNNYEEYLNVKESPWDKDNEYILEIDKEEFKSKLNISKEIIINNIERNESNRVSTITINDITYTGIELRKILNLRSTDFNIEINDVIKITTKGYGHGVGMSQYGANNMSKEGYDYKDILNYYYPNTKIEEI